VGQTLCGRAEDRGERRGTLGASRVARSALLGLRVARSRGLLRGLIAAAVVALQFQTGARPLGAQEAPERIDRGRFTAVFFPEDRVLATSLLDGAVKNDSFPGLPRPRERVLLAIAPDHRRFREWIGPGAPEWGAAITFPESHRIVMQGRASGSDAGDPREVLRHEIAHLALHESLGDLPPRWFDEGYASYAAREWTREDALTTNVALALRGTPTFDELDRQFSGGSMAAQNAYALAYRAVVELASIDPVTGLSRFFNAWRETRSMDASLRSEFGLTLAGYEQRWRQSTRRRYGMLALFSNVALAGAILIVLVFPLYIARRQRDKVRLAAMVAADEAAERAARSSAIEALLRGDDWSDLGGESPPAAPPPPPS